MLSFTVVIEAVGWIGVLLYVIAYYLVSAGRLSGRSPRYQNMNLIGAFGVAANAFYYGAYPSAIVNVIWFCIAAATLLGVIRSSEEADPAHPESPEGRAMHKILFFAGGVLAIFGLGLAVIALSPRPPRPLQQVLVYTQDWPPYIDRRQPGGGPLSELVRDLFRKAGYNAQLRFADWDEALDNVETGIAVAAFPFIDNRDRAERLLFTEPLLTFDYVLFYRRGLEAPDGLRGEEALLAWLDSPETHANVDNDVSPFLSWTLGAVEGYALWPALADAEAPEQRFDSPLEAFRRLERGDIVALAEGRLVGLHTIQNPASGIDASRILPVELDDPRVRSQEALRLVTRATPDGKALRDQLNSSIDELLARGELRELQERLETHSRTVVRMRSLTEVVHPELDDGRRMVAAGTRALVLSWPAPFDRAETVQDRGGDIGDRRCLVKLLNGPLRGWEVHVAPDTFEIAEPRVDP